MINISSKRKELVEDAKKRRILFVVDGDVSYLYYTGMLLQRLGYSIYTAKTAEEALEVMKFALPLLVLTEMSLPQMGGMELLRRIKQDPNTSSVPVVVYTALPDPSLKYRWQDEGGAAYLRKPFDPDELYAIIQQATETNPRRYTRLHTCLSVMFGDDRERARSMIDCVTAVSENGMYLSTSKPLPTGMHLVMTLFLGSIEIRVEGVVLYSFDAEGPTGTPGMGIKFINMNSEDRGLLHTFIKKELTHDIAQHEHKKEK